ncbi:serine protease [Roseobacter weihaiensis]|uniref:serine protease n=1 Tax=Roseobacter weihaiensis TaxID=2763262 RepID=UPI001D0ABDA7|nr:trypsin-like peptidase domain-containing protein [Roseobacter sp. H9]
MKRLVLLFWVLCNLVPQAVSAQTAREVVWVQIEARPTLETALERVKSYAVTLPDVNGFALSGGWYAIALGPYTPEDAQQVLRSYRVQGLIPNDSYIALSATYGQQYFPPDADGLDGGAVAAIQTPSEPESQAPAPDVQTAPTASETAAHPQTEPDTETRAQAQRSESLLSRAEKRALQTALQWAGFYNAAIDGAFGRGTRNSMAAWQGANGYDPTGVLTTRQRAVLIGQYNAVLEGLDMQIVQDFDAGIEVRLPTAVVAFERYEPPFAQYNAAGDLAARVLLISQPGDRTTLAGLYEVMQTLTIVPLDGPRSLSGDSFTLVGRNAEIVSETQVTLASGEIKGFTLIWPAGDEERRSRVLQEMQNSFVRRSGVLDPGAGETADQQIDLVAGLEVRKPILSRSGFFVDAAGAVVTTSDAVQSCARITLDERYDAMLSGVDTDRGIAILKPKQTLAPPAVARFSPVPPRLQSEIAVAGYSFEGQLGAPSMTFGTLSDLKGLRGEPDVSRLALETLPGDAGGPVLDRSGNVLGMLLPRVEGTRQLPEEVRFALTGEAISSVMVQAGLSLSEGVETASLDPEDITDRGIGMTVLVSCWE